MVKRVVITGAGVISPLGLDTAELISSVKSGKNGIGIIDSFECEGIKTRLAAEVRNFDPVKAGIEAYRKKDRFLQFAIAAAKQAYADSGYEINEENCYNTGVVLGSGIGGLITIENESEKLIEKGPRKVSSHFIPKSIINMAPGNISIELGTKGVCIADVSACASGTDSIGHAFRLIKDGYQEAVFAGGCESSICRLGVAGFESMGALSLSDDISRASIPFDRERNGFVMGEGAAVLLLESLDSAIKRNARIICEVVGFGQTSDSYHITAPDPNAISASEAMRRAISEAGITCCDIDYINAHGTGTKLNDEMETNAVKNVFGDYSSKIYISSTKSMTGHLLGAAGALETVICAYALKECFIPPTINYREKDEKCDLNYVTNGCMYENLKYVMNNSFGFGGHNSSIILKKYIDI